MIRLEAHLKSQPLAVGASRLANSVVDDRVDHGYQKVHGNFALNAL